MKEPSRRTLLAVGGGLLAGFAGCQGDRAPTASPRTTTKGPAAGVAATMDDATANPATSADELDLREANVLDVTVERSDDDSYRFSVTLYHDDDGEEGYANWWQVERLDGTKLGRRKLLHAHSTAPFTRSGTIEIPGGVDCVVVRGHDQTHGYGGQAAVVTIETGAVSFVRQGAERPSVEGIGCR